MKRPTCLVGVLDDYWYDAATTNESYSGKGLRIKLFSRPSIWWDAGLHSDAGISEPVEVECEEPEA